MSDSFTNARSYFDVTFPSSGDSFSIAGFRNALSGLGFLDAIPLQPRAHNPPDRSIMVRGQDAARYYNPVYFGDSNARIPINSGDTALFAVPASNPRIDIVYITPSGDIKVMQGTEASVPTLPSLAPSGDSRFPVAAVWCKVGMAKVVNYEDKDSNSGDGYIYKDLRPWMRNASMGGTQLTALTAANPTGDNLPGTATTASRADHHHEGVHTLRKVGSSNMFGDVEVAASGDLMSISQQSNRLTFGAVAPAGSVIGFANFNTGAVATGAGTVANDDTIPEVTEGNLFMTLPAYTPKVVGSKICVQVVLCVNESTNTGASCPVWLHELGIDAQFALAVGTADSTAYNGTSAPPNVVFTHVLTTTSLAPLNFTVRAGNDVGAVTVNGVNGGRKWGGKLLSSITLWEIK